MNEHVPGCRYGGACQPLKSEDPLCNATIDPFILQWGSPVAALQCDENQYLLYSKTNEPVDHTNAISSIADFYPCTTDIYPLNARAQGRWSDLN